MTAIAGFLTVLLSCITALGGWLFGKRKRKNDFISQLQSSIDLLSEKYTETLKELILVKDQNTKLLIGQNEMAVEIKTLRKENAGLKKEVEELTLKLQDVKIITRQAK